MLRCSTCLGNPQPPPPPSSPAARPSLCVRGDICAIYASVSTPIEQVLQTTQEIYEDPDALFRSQYALHEIKRKGIGKLRPCIVSRQAIPGMRSAEVFLMGTLERRPMDSDGVCEVLRHFCKPIFPNLGLPGSRHYHTTPTWPHAYQWLIGFGVELEKSVPLVHWEFKEGSEYAIQPPGTVYTMDEDTLDALEEHCANTFAVWTIRCKNEPAFAEACEQEWRNQEATLSKISLNLPAPASASTVSLASSRRVSRAPSLRTVHEGSRKGSWKQAFGGGKMTRLPLQDINIQQGGVDRRTHCDSVAGSSIRSTLSQDSKGRSRKSKRKQSIC